MQNLADPPKDPPVDETIQLRGSDPKDLVKINKLLEELRAKEKPSATPQITPPPDPQKNADTEELNKYRELERQNILTELPKELQEEYKEKTLKEVRTINKAYSSFMKKDVGQTPPSPDAPTEKEKVFGWNVITQKNEEH